MKSKIYTNLFKLNFTMGLQYRKAALAGVATQIVFGFVFIFVYLAFYSSNDISNAPMEWKGVVSYLWLNQAFFSIVYIWIKDKELINLIKNGNIAYELCRPISFFKKWFVTLFSKRVASVILRSVPLLLIAFLLPDKYSLELPNGIIAFFAFTILLILAAILTSAIAYLYHILVFITLDEKGVMSFLMAFGEVFSGGSVPISFFPTFLQKVAYVLPFRFICDYPFRIYSGDIPISDAFNGILLSIMWIIIFMTFGYLLTKYVLKKAVVQGG